MSDSQHPTGSFFPSPPPVRPDVAEYVKAFDKPLTMDEKTAWLAEITHLVLQGVLPQEVYPALKDKIESLPTITPAKDRPDEKLPGSDYVYPGPSKPLTATRIGRRSGMILPRMNPETWLGCIFLNLKRKTFMNYEKCRFVRFYHEPFYFTLLKSSPSGRM